MGLDSPSLGLNAGGTDQNIPSVSVFDADGRPVESVLPPHALPTISAPSQPLVTTTAYDLAGRTESVSVNATAAYPSTVAADTDVGYWPLDERSGTTIDDKVSATDLILSGGAALAAASALDEARTGIDFDGTTGTASRASAVSSLTNNFTIEAWFRADALPSAGSYALFAYNGTETAGWGIGLDFEWCPRCTLRLGQLAGGECDGQTRDVSPRGARPERRDRHSVPRRDRVHANECDEHPGNPGRGVLHRS